MKKIILLYIICGLNVSYAQTKVTLNVPSIPQEAKHWCWAASIKMVMQSFGKPATQCDLALQYLRSTGFVSSIPPINTNCNNCTDCMKKSNESCFPLDVDLKLPSHYKAILGTKKITSFLDIGKITSWNTIKTEINSQRSSIIILELDPMLQHTFESLVHWTGAHAVVAKGYLECNGQKFIQINNPWQPCVGCSYWIAYETVSTDAFFFKCAGYVNKIYPITPPMSPPYPVKTITNSCKINNLKVNDIISTNLSTRGNEVEYVVCTTPGSCKTVSTGITYYKKNNTIPAITKQNNTIIQIGNCDYLFPKSLDNNIFLSNEHEQVPSNYIKTGYTQLHFPLLFLQFYRFKIGDTYYLTPNQDFTLDKKYPIGQYSNGQISIVQIESLSQKQAYEEKSVLDTLYSITKDYKGE